MSNNNLSKFLEFVTKKDEITLIGPLELKITPKKGTALLLVDGGKNHFLDSDSPKISIGDGDSSTSGPMDIKHDCDKDQTDFELALETIPKNIKKVNIHGMVGGQLDHQLAIFGSLNHFLIKNPHSKVYLDDIFICLSGGEHQVSINKGPFSILSVLPNEIVMTGDMKYQLKTKTQIMPFSGLGVSNYSNDGEMYIKSAYPVLVFIGQILH